MKLQIFSLIGLVFIITACSSDNKELAIVRLAKQQGVERCLEDLKVAAEDIINDTTNVSQVYNASGSNSDKHILMSLSMKSYVDNASHVSIHVAPNSSDGNDGCDVMIYETYLKEGRCDDLRKKEFALWEFQEKLRTSPSFVLESSNKRTHFLTPVLKDKMCMVTQYARLSRVSEK